MESVRISREEAEKFFDEHPDTRLCSIHGWWTPAFKAGIKHALDYLNGVISKELEWMEKENLDASRKN